MDWFQMAGLRNLLSNYFKTEALFSIVRKFVFSILSVGPIPNHIAFILDGNRRYARNWNMQEGEGNKVGFLALMSMLNYCYELWIKYVTLYAFSIDNFNRWPNEVQYVMDLLQEKIEGLLKEESIVNNYRIRVYFLGNLKLLNELVRLAAKKAMAATAKNDKAVLMICVAYTSIDEIVHVVQESYNEKKDDIRHHEIDKELPIKLVDLEKHMYMAVALDADILVRTSGETCLSNFLLWQTTFCQLYSPNALWPEISLRHLEIEAIGAFSILVELRRTKWVHCSTIRGGSAPEVEIGTALLNTSSKYGAIDASSKVFDKMLQESIVSRSAMIATYGMHVNMQNALVLLIEMK
ncbi:hypothetical protein GIB67_027277, partial [Kingdonia uniflora]